MDTSRIRIAFLTPQDPLDKGSWSGTLYFMAKALRKHCGDVMILGPAPFKQHAGKIINRIAKVVLNRPYDYSHSISYARDCARFFQNRLNAAGCDVIFAPAAASGIAFLQTRIPIVYASDATFALLQGYYPEFTKLLKKSAQEGNVVEREAIAKAAAVLYSSDWAARSAVSDYGANPSRIRIIPFGANLESVLPEKAATAKRGTGRCRLLFLAVNWARKGGPLAFETLQHLLKRGIDAELIVCGCVPPPGARHERVIVIPFLNKDDPEHREQLEALFLSSGFLLLPTRHDCTPIVFCEANGFGLPVITSDTGGVSSVIRNGENGYMLPLQSGGADYAGLISEVYGNDCRYSALRRSSRAAFDERLNWDSWAKAAGTVFRSILNDKSSTRQPQHERSVPIAKNSILGSGRGHDPDDQDRGISCSPRHQG